MEASTFLRERVTLGVTIHMLFRGQHGWSTAIVIVKMIVGVDLLTCEWSVQRADQHWGRRYGSAQSFSSVSRGGSGLMQQKKRQLW